MTQESCSFLGVLRTGSRTRQRLIVSASTCALLVLAARGGAWADPFGSPPGEAKAPKAVTSALKTRTRPSGQSVAVDPSIITIDDTVVLRWPDGDVETVRTLGIDSPETRHDEHNIPLDQPLGAEARAFAPGRSRPPRPSNCCGRACSIRMVGRSAT